MNKRYVAAALWLFAGWYVGAAVATYLGFPDSIGLIGGVGLAIIVAGDPLRVLWKVSAVRDGDD